MGPSDRLPAALRGGVELMLARAVETIPQPADGRAGSLLYEPKWDGWRMAICRDGQRTTLWSRRGTDLTTRFPELVAAAEEQVPPGTALDGEAVIWQHDRLAFDLLQRRMAGGPATIARLARETPASFIGFDVLAHDGADLRELPLRERRALLERLARDWSPPMNLSPVTSDPYTAARWLEEFTVAGVEGLVVKDAARRYEPGQRGWSKVKVRNTVDVIVAAVLGPLTRPDMIVAGLPIDGDLLMVGRSVPLSAMASKSLGAQLVAADPTGHPWPERTTSAAVTGWRGSRDPVALTLIEPIVAEVSADVSWSGRSFRHAVRFVRPRPDLDPAEVAPPW